MRSRNRWRFVIGVYRPNVGSGGRRTGQRWRESANFSGQREFAEGGRAKLREMAGAGETISGSALTAFSIPWDGLGSPAYVPQPPDPHHGAPHPPADGFGDSQIGRLVDVPAVCAAGTLSNRSSRSLPQAGQAGVSLPRTSSSNSSRHLAQVYS
jgi:hypothetical protein